MWPSPGKLLEVGNPRSSEVVRGTERESSVKEPCMKSDPGRHRRSFPGKRLRRRLLSQNSPERDVTS